MTFADDRKTDGLIFVNLEDFGESATYIFADNTRRSVQISIQRRPVDEAPYDSRPEGPSRSPRRVIDIFISRDGTVGVDSVTPKRDRIELAPRIGSNVTPISMVVSEILDEWVGGFQLRLQA